LAFKTPTSDGGGGALPAGRLTAVSDNYKKPDADVYTGTSASGILLTIAI